MLADCFPDMLQLAGCPVSNNPYVQVALTYIRRLFRRGNFLFLIFACPMLFMAANSRDAFAMLPLLMCIPFLLLQFASHVVAPFADGAPILCRTSVTFMP